MIQLCKHKHIELYVPTSSELLQDTLQTESCWNVQTIDCFSIENGDHFRLFRVSLGLFALTKGIFSSLNCQNGCWTLCSKVKRFCSHNTHWRQGMAKCVLVQATTTRNISRDPRNIVRTRVRANVRVPCTPSMEQSLSSACEKLDCWRTVWWAKRLTWQPAHAASQEMWELLLRIYLSVRCLSLSHRVRARKRACECTDPFW